jgi:hypothetical protein
MLLFFTFHPFHLKSFETESEKGRKVENFSPFGDQVINMLQLAISNIYAIAIRVIQ